VAFEPTVASNSDGDAEPEGTNRYTVHVRDGSGWTVAIVDPNGEDAALRACASEAEALTFASTVRQHIGWLSEERFRQIYRVEEVG
jgi:hypothetical protein